MTKRILTLFLLLAVTASAEIKQVTQYNDITALDPFSSRIDIWQGDSVTFDVVARYGRTPVDLTGSAFPVWMVGSWTNLGQVYIAATGTVISATNGHVRVTVLPSATLLPATNYWAQMRVFRVTDGTTQEAAIVSYSMLSVNESIDVSASEIIAPLDPPWTFDVTINNYGGGGDLSNLSNAVAGASNLALAAYALGSNNAAGVAAVGASATGANERVTGLGESVSNNYFALTLITNDATQGYVLAADIGEGYTNYYYVEMAAGGGNLTATNTPTAGQMLYADGTDNETLYWADAPAGGGGDLSALSNAVNAIGWNGSEPTVLTAVDGTLTIPYTNSRTFACALSGAATVTVDTASFTTNDVFSVRLDIDGSSLSLTLPTSVVANAGYYSSTNVTINANGRTTLFLDKPWKGSFPCRVASY